MRWSDNYGGSGEIECSGWGMRREEDAINKKIESSKRRESSSVENGSESQAGDMGEEGNGAMDWVCLLSVRVRVIDG